MPCEDMGVSATHPLLFGAWILEAPILPVVPSNAQIRHFLHNETTYGAVLQVAAGWVACFDAWDKNLTNLMHS